MPEPLRFSGTPVSRGYAEGPLFALGEEADPYTRKASSKLEEEALRAAIAQARAEITALMNTAEGDGAEILAFQLAMLEDDNLAEPAWAVMMAGQSARRAWTATLDTEIAGYEASEDEHFRSRAADLRDIRDRVLKALTGARAPRAPPGVILWGEDITPSRFLETDWRQGGGIALKKGSGNSHVAMLARSRGVPMVVGIGPAPPGLEGLALLDAEAGGVVVSPAAEEIRSFRVCRDAFRARFEIEKHFVARPARTVDGRHIRVLVNIADPAELDGLDPAACDGVGLMRTEFLFSGERGLPDEQEQLAAYRKLMEWAGEKPVTIRTVDAGGDKPVAGYTLAEMNPFLGLRGIRLSLARPDIFRIQVRALLRAAVMGRLKVMLPMVTLPAELDSARAIFLEEAAALGAAGVPHALPPLGIMVEVPATAIVPEAFAEAAFLSIGSNDLTQYVMAAARDLDTVAGLHDALHPAVLRLIENVVRFGQAQNVPVSLCGDAGSDPRAIPALLRAGLRELSVAPAALAAVKAAIAAVELER